MTSLFVVYIDQQTGAPHTPLAGGKNIFALSHAFPSFFPSQTEKKKNAQSVKVLFLNTLVDTQALVDSRVNVSFFVHFSLIFCICDRKRRNKLVKIHNTWEWNELNEESFKLSLTWSWSNLRLHKTYRPAFVATFLA